MNANGAMSVEEWLISEVHTDVCALDGRATDDNRSQQR